MDSCRPRKIPHHRLSCHCLCSMMPRPIAKIGSTDQAHYLTHLFVAVVSYRHEGNKKRTRVSIPRGTEREGAATVTAARAAIPQSRPKQSIVEMFGIGLSQRVCTHIWSHADTASLCIARRIHTNPYRSKSFPNSDIFKERGITPILS